MTAGVLNWLHGLDAYFFAKGFDILVSHWTNAPTEVVLMAKATGHVCISVC